MPSSSLNPESTYCLVQLYFLVFLAGWVSSYQRFSRNGQIFCLAFFFFLHFSKRKKKKLFKQVMLEWQDFPLLQLCCKVLDSIGGAESYNVSVSCVGSPANVQGLDSVPAPQSQKNLSCLMNSTSWPW